MKENKQGKYEYFWKLKKQVMININNKYFLLQNTFYLETLRFKSKWTNIFNAWEERQKRAFLLIFSKG